MSLPYWQEKAKQAVEKASPYIKKSGKWFIVNIVTPLLYYGKELVLGVTATIIAGGRTTWQVLIEPLLEGIVSRIYAFFWWAVDEAAKSGRWFWQRLTPWN